jgi:hypothetical protein
LRRSPQCRDCADCRRDDRVSAGSNAHGDSDAGGGSALSHTLIDADLGTHGDADAEWAGRA